MIDPDKLLIELAHVSELAPEQWAGKCFEMACCLVKHKLVEGIAVYGHWRGPIAKGSMFDKGMPFAQHGWVKRESVRYRIVDPTRWVFEGKNPYIYVGPCDHYDEGGNQFRQTQHKCAPSYGATDDPIWLEKLPNRTWKHVQTMLTLGGTDAPNPVRVVSIAQLFWLANQPPKSFEEHAPAFYAALLRIGRYSLIPIDNQRMVERGDWMDL